MPRRPHHTLPCTILLILFAAGSMAASSGDPRFLENRGQIRDTDGRQRPDIAFTAEIDGARHFYGGTGYSIVFFSADDAGRERGRHFTHDGAVAGRDDARVLSGWRMDVTFVDANPDVRIIPMDADGILHRFHSPRDPMGTTPVRGYQRIRYENLWDRIDAEFLLVDGAYKYEFIVHPGGAPSDIRLRFAGTESMRIDTEGRLRITTPLGGFTEDAPFSFQQDAGRRSVVESGFRLEGHDLCFALGNWDRRSTLVIDPWATYHGGSGMDAASDVVTDGDGNITVVGETTSTDFPVQRAQYATLAGNTDAFLLRFAPDGSLIWATYYGGAMLDRPYTLASDGSGNLYMSGWTSSSDLPLSGAFQSSAGGGMDAFVASFDSSGQLRWATYIGGSGDDYSNALASDAAGNVYVIGQTKSTNFPLLAAFQSVHAGADDAFIMKFSHSGVLRWSTLYGGSGNDYATGVATRPDGSAVIGGFTASTDFPTHNAWQNTAAGGGDVFALAFDSSGSRAWAGYYGGTAIDYVTRLKTDGAGNTVIAAFTRSSDFPVHQAWQPALGGKTDALVMKVDTAGRPVWATYFGGSESDTPYGLHVTTAGSIGITGASTSDDLPTQYAHQPARAGESDVLVARFDSSGALLWSSYYGGSDDDVGNGIAIDHNGNVILCGYSESSDLPVYSGLQGQLSGTSDAMIVHFAANGYIPVELLSFSARMIDRAVHLSWETASETGNLGFEVQRSLDGGDWKHIGFVSGSGTTSVGNRYRFTDQLETTSDAGIAPPSLRYRLRQIDFDGSASWSPIIHVRSQQTSTPRLDIRTVHPSPAHAQVTVQFETEMGSPAMLTLHDMLGREVYRSRPTDDRGGTFSTTIRTALLPPGSYLLTLRAGGEQRTRLLRVLR